MFFENNTHEAWRDAKQLGGLEELEAARPKVKPRIYAMYNLFSKLRREADELKPIRAALILDDVTVLSYEPDKALAVIQAADDHYLKLCADKIKRMNANGR